MEKKNRVGRPSIKNKKVTLAVRVTPEVKEWLDSQEESAGAIIDKTIKALINEQIDLFD